MFEQDFEKNELHPQVGEQFTDEVLDVIERFKGGIALSTVIGCFEIIKQELINEALEISDKSNDIERFGDLPDEFNN